MYPCILFLPIEMLEALEADLHNKVQQACVWQTTMEHHLANLPGLLTKYKGFLLLKPRE